MLLEGSLVLLPQNLNMLCVFILPSPDPLTVLIFFFVSAHFPEYHMVGIIQYVTFSDRLPSPSDNAFKVLLYRWMAFR